MAGCGGGVWTAGSDGSILRGVRAGATPLMTMTGATGGWRCWSSSCSAASWACSSSSSSAETTRKRTTARAWTTSSTASQWKCSRARTPRLTPRLKRPVYIKLNIKFQRCSPLRCVWLSIRPRQVPYHEPTDNGCWFMKGTFLGRLGSQHR